MRVSFVFALATALLLAGTVNAQEEKAPAKPNILVIWGDDVGQFLMTFKEYPPRMKAASFSLDRVMKKIESAGAR